jgi:hypothetical protein
LTVHAEHFRCRLIRCARRVEIALLHGVAVAVVAVLFDFLLRLAFRRVGDNIVRIRCLLNRLRLLRRIHRLDVLRRLGDYVFLGVLLVGVIGPGSDEKQRAAKPDLLRVVGQVADANAPWRLDNYITRALWAIPVTAGVEVIPAAIRHPRVTTRHAIDLVTRPIARARSPAVAMTTGAAGLPVAVIGTTVAVAPAVVSGLVAVEALTRLLGLNHRVRPSLNRQTTLTVLQLTLLLLLFLLASLLILLLLALLLLALIVTLLIALAILLLALLIGALLLVLLDLALLLHLFLLALLLLLILLLLALLLLFTLLVVVEAALVLLLLALHLEPTLLLLALLLLVTLLLLLLIIVVGQHLSTDAQGQETDTCQTPDARVHAFLTTARIPMG